MEQSLSTLLKKHCELMDYCLKDDSSMQLIQERVKMKKPLDSLLWLEIQRLIVGMEPAFLRRLKKVAPDLTEKERQLCCLLRLHVPVDYIAVLLQLSKSSVAVYKSDILKKRFEIQGTPLSLLLFLL